MTQRILLNFSILLTGLLSFSQIEELEKKLPKLKGKEKVQCLADLSFYYSSVDVEKGIHYGRLSYSEVSKLKDPALQAQVLSDWSISYYNKGAYDSVLLLMKKAMPLAIKSGDEILIAKVYNKRALAHFELGSFELALQENIKALRVFEKVGALPQVAQLEINIGVIYEKTRNFSEAEIYYTQALKTATELNDHNILSSVYGNLGVLFMKQHKYEKANEMYFKCIEYIDKKSQLHFLCIVYQNIGVNFRNKGDIKNGLNYYLKARSIAEQLKSKSAMAPILSNIGQCYMDLKDFEKSESYLIQSLELAKEIRSYPELRNSYKGLTRLEHLRGNYEKADGYFDQYIEFQDSIYSEKNNRALNEISVKYKTEKKEKELLKERLRSSSFKSWSWILGLSFVSALLGILLILLRRTSEKRRLELKRLQDLEFERMRISRDLHDNIGAELTFITSKLDLKAATTARSEEQKELNELATLSRGASVLLRETIWSIRQDSIGKNDLLEKMVQFAERCDVNNTIKIVAATEYYNDQTIESSKALHLYRIAQETINNSIKYANPSELKILFTEDALEIVDNGCGFDTSNYNPGYGILNIKQRAEEMGAQFILTSSKNGTIVRIEGV
ncbi:MAG: tetratricopeptide repeat-containing sensor histidine kinase [Fluviicola sp.]|jgi:signal transduction histidine kinase